MSLQKMITEIRIRFNQVLETWKEKGVFYLFNIYVFVNREIIPVVMDLNSLKPHALSAERGNFKLIEILKDRIENTRFVYPFKSRYLKMLRNLNKGYKGFAIVKGDEVIGDIWYVSVNNFGTRMKHPDLKLLDIHLNKNDVYMFDMYVKPEERGGGVVNFLLGSALNELKEKGFIKVYGYYMAHNIPALWVHRMLGYKEMKRLKWNRLILIKWRADRK